MTEAARITQVVSEFNAGENEKSKIRSRVGSSSSAVSGTASTAAMGMNALSLPSVPSLPSMSRPSDSTHAQSSSGYGQASASALSLPGTHTTGSGNRTFGGGSTGGGSRPGTRDGIAVPAMEPGARFGASITAPRSGKMVYVLVAVLIAANCVLAVLLFSGDGPSGPGDRT